VLVEWFSSRRILNGMKNSSRKVGTIEVVQYGIEKVEVGKIEVQAMGEYLSVMELRGNNQTVETSFLVYTFTTS
jgi:hypothetical protein